MTTQYRRAYELTIGSESLGLKFTELQIVFEVTKDLYGFPNLARIDVYNLSEDSMAEINERGTNVLLKAGYEGNIRTIFAGQIANIVILREGVDKITRIWARDAQVQLEGAFTSRTFSAGLTVKQIIESLLADFPSPVTDIVVEINDTLSSPLSYSGPTGRLLDKLATTYGFNWSFQNGALKIILDDDIDRLNPVIRISRRTGMIGSPVITEIGVDVQTLLNPDLVPYGVFKTETVTPDVRLGNTFFRTINRSLGNGYFRINKVVHTGEFRGTPWYSKVVGRSSGINPFAFNQIVAAQI